ncbi:MAG: PEP-utilizing enzyme [Patescibacteria group bacterium]|nr:PEP-utilizing enzyme [Patescibacteria group bacterium]
MVASIKSNNGGDKMKEEQKWIVILNRRSTIFFHNLVVKGQAKKYYKEMYDFDFEIQNFKYVAGEVTIGLSDLAELGRLLGQRIGRRPECLDEFMERGYKQCDRLLKISKEISTLKNLEKMSNQELLDWYNRYIEEVLRMMPSLMTTPTIERILEEKIKEGLKEIFEKFGKKESPEAYLSDLVFTKKDNFVVQELEELMEIGVEIQKDSNVLNIFSASVSEDIQKQLAKEKKELLSKIKNHAQKFGFLNMYGYEGKPMSVGDVIVRLKELLRDDCAKKLEEAKKAKQTVQKRYDELLKVFGISGELLKYIEYAQEYLYFRLYRLDILMIAGCYVRDFMDEIAQRIGISYDDIIHLWHEELRDFLKTGQLPDTSKIKERKENYATLLVDGKFEILSGKELEDFILQEKKPEAELEKPITELEGITACYGKHKGTAKIVLINEDIDKVKEGDVLVSTMTNPYYLPAMIRAKAIVCDEGGILSHAAIVSRELGIPCVIGTKIATKVVEDGDLADVDASQKKGIVKIHKQGKI